MGCAVIWSYVELFGTTRLRQAVFVDQVSSSKRGDCMVIQSVIFEVLCVYGWRVHVDLVTTELQGTPHSSYYTCWLIINPQLHFLLLVATSC